MEYRQIGNTGVMASILGMGGEHLDGKPYPQVEATVRAALDAGVNHLDVFMPGQEVRRNIAKALGDRRKDVTIQGHIGSTDVGQQYDISRDMPTVRKYFEDLLRIFGYIDFGMLFFIDSQKDYQGVFETPFIDYALKLKETGDIRHIGFSSHNPVMARQVIQTGLVEMMMFSINLAFDLYPAQVNALDQLNQGLSNEAFSGLDPQRAALYQLCASKGVGITVMKTLGAGKLISPEHTPFAQPMTVNQCLHYALTRPGVASVMLGYQSPQDVEKAMEYLSASQAQRDYTPVLGTLRSDFRGKCVYCGHCQPCPAGIDIAAVNKYLDIARLDPDHVPPSVRAHYMALEHKGSQCLSCGRCQQRCPFGVDVIGNMAQAARLFEGA